MRKDLHVGLAIGGVLLAVLIVWGVVVNHGKQHNKQVTLETTASGGTGSEIPPPVAPADGASPIATPDAGSTPAVAPAPTTPVADPSAGAAPATPAAPAVAETKDTNWTALLAGSGTIPPAADAAPAAPITVADATPKNDPVADARSQITAPASPADGSTQTADSKTSSITTTPPIVSSALPSVHVDGAAVSRTHKVAKGETFASISRAVYGDSRYYDQIAQANPKINPNRLRPGTIINLPDAAEVKASSKPEPRTETAANSASASPRKTSSPAAVDSQKEYRVVAGDSLYKISMHLYGSGEEVDHIYALNKETIGPDESKLKLGMLLKIPAPPTVATASAR